ncbi:MAG TPA: GntR family transcriptional regulator [Xanthobacteraceae bacterium]|nr:GntR family transcriptional regulator [Xanthobacteraceae bacterium]
MPTLASLDRAATQSDQAYEVIKAEILDCRLAPGAKVTISEVAMRLGFSPGAVREALSRLAAEQWTVATAQKGYSVTPVSPAELRDLTRTRITIEQICLRSAIAHGDVEWESSIVAAYHRLHRIPIQIAGSKMPLNPAWVAAHTTYHAALTAACDSPWMLTLRAMLYAKSERYRHLSAVLARENRDVDAEHKAILNACLKRDADHACALIEEHLNRTSAIVVTSPMLRDGSATGGNAP